MGEEKVVLPLSHVIGIFIAECKAQPHGLSPGVNHVETGKFGFFAAIKGKGWLWQWAAGSYQPLAIALVKPFGLHAHVAFGGLAALKTHLEHP